MSPGEDRWETVFEFRYRGRAFKVERRFLLPVRAARRADGVPFWHLSRLGLGIVVLASELTDTRQAVEARFTAWLDERYYRFTLRGIEYEFYRIPRDFWSPEKEALLPSGVWEVRHGGASVSQFPETAAQSASAALSLFMKELTQDAVECFGGPLDGERVGERGAEFEAIWEWDEHLDEDQARRMRRPHRGRYRRTAGGYEWAGE